MTCTSVDPAACPPFTKNNTNRFVLMPGVRCNLCFDYGEGDCLPRCCHGIDGFKNTLKQFLQKKYSHCCLVNIYIEMRQNMYDADKKSEIIFETCFPLIFFNECPSPDKFLLNSNNYHALGVTVLPHDVWLDTSSDADEH